MLRNVKDLEGYAVGATDGTIGHVEDFFFDDRAWIIRYLVVDAGGWLASRKVLISPIAIGRPDWTERRLPVSLTKEQVKNSPDIDTEQARLTTARSAVLQVLRLSVLLGRCRLLGRRHVSEPDDAWLRRLRVAAGHPLGRRDRLCEGGSRPKPRGRSPPAQLPGSHEIPRHASDGEIGHVEGILVDDASWAIRYLIVNTSNWWLGHRVLIAPQWIDAVGWFDSKVSVKMTRQAIKDAPAYDPAVPLDRGQEAGLYEHYGHVGYWAEDARRETEISRM